MSATLAQELSASNSQAAKNEKCIYRKGALGFAQIWENLKDELVGEPPARQRWLAWRVSRTNKDGNIVEEEVRTLIEDGVSLFSLNGVGASPDMYLFMSLNEGLWNHS